MAFKKGESGNPNGARVKSAEQREFEAKCRQWCKEFAFGMLAKKAFSDDEKISTWALEAILNRAFGKPVEMSVVDANVTASVGSSTEEIAGELAGLISGPAPESVGDASQAQVDGGK